jgi:undecaprenyl phosphate N,N'-diacetylbacillosamine 1-phosphate transferase
LVVNRFFKRIVDIFIALPAAVVLLPVFVVIFAAIKITSKGPAIFKHERAGQNGTPFIFYKFRTMKLDAEPFGPSPKSGDDSRLTKIGRFLREHSLDELPQLFNVIKGNMSIVGPRPLYVSQIAEWNERQKKRLLVKPGITGLAQISGRGRLTREEKLELDVKYVEAASFLADIKILIATIGQVLGRESIYERRYSKTEYTRTEGK